MTAAALLLELSAEALDLPLLRHNLAHEVLAVVFLRLELRAQNLVLLLCDFEAPVEKLRPLARVVELSAQLRHLFDPLLARLGRALLLRLNLRLDVVQAGAESAQQIRLVLLREALAPLLERLDARQHLTVQRAHLRHRIVLLLRLASLLRGFERLLQARNLLAVLRLATQIGLLPTLRVLLRGRQLLARLLQLLAQLTCCRCRCGGRTRRP
mmetsp:Transcript_1304/g.4856  ORF Transcript_1304/g.4856 Transcript_1304/m.4856 type:complete len:212 (+) Transcript_1304:712-1347(+)